MILVPGATGLRLDTLARSLHGVDRAMLISSADPAMLARKGQVAAGIPPYLVDALAELFAERRRGKESQVSPAAETILGRRPTSFAELALRNAAVFRGEPPPPRARRRRGLNRPRRGSPGSASSPPCPDR